MGIKGLNWDEVNERVPMIAARRSSITTGDKLATLVLLANRLRPEDHTAHRRRLDAINDDLRALHVMRQMETKLRDAMKEAFIAGIYAASDAEYVPANEEIARLLAEARAQLIATPEGEDLRAPQTNGENGVTQV
jgi:hypothetical protein